MDQGQTGGKAAQAAFDAADAGTRAALINFAHGKAFIEDQDRLEGVPERAARRNAEIDAEAHPFQRAGLGLAPFRFTGMEHRTYQASPEAPVQPGGSCDYCGTGISYFCWILSADGRRFKVGTDCVRKTDTALYKEAKDAEKAERAADRRAARARDLAEEEERVRSSRVLKASFFMDQHAGLSAALTSGLDSPILKDMHARLVRFGSLSQAQISFALRLADEIRNPRPADVHVPAPEGRVTFRATVVSVKEVEDRFSFRPDAYTLKMTVRVQADGGVWLAWMTVPLSEGRPERGQEMTITATLTRGSDAHFAFGKRPVVWTAEQVQEATDKAARKAARAAKKEKANA